MDQGILERESLRACSCPITPAPHADAHTMRKTSLFGMQIILSVTALAPSDVSQSSYRPASLVAAAHTLSGNVMRWSTSAAVLPSLPSS